MELIIVCDWYFQNKHQWDYGIAILYEYRQRGYIEYWIEEQGHIRVAARRYLFE